MPRARKSNFSDKDCVFKTVMSILNQTTQKRFDLLKDQLIISGITSADTLKGVVSLIFDKAILEPTFSSMYAQLCSDLNEKLPSFPSDEPGGKVITFKRVLCNNCQVVFESAHKLREEARQMTAPEQESERKDKEWLIKLRYLGNIRLTCELFKQQIFPEKIVHHIVQKLLGIDPTKCPEEENVEAICQVFNIICEQLDKNEKSRRINDVYFRRLKELSTNPQLGPRLRLMVCDVLDLRPSNLVRRRDEVVNISDHILKIKEEVEAELYGENASRYHVDINTTGDSRFEVCERVRYTRDQLLQLRNNILKLKQEVEAELFGQDANQGGLADTNGQTQSRCSEPDTDDQLSKLAQFSAPIEDRSLDLLRENSEFGTRFYSREQEVDECDVQEQLSSQFARTQMSINHWIQSQTCHSEPGTCENGEYNDKEQLSSQGVPDPTLTKAELPCPAARKNNFSDRDCVFKTVMSILNQPTQKKFDLIKDQLIISRITSAYTLKGVVSLIFDKAILEPTFSSMYAQLCSDLNEKLPSFPSDEPGGKVITFKRVLCNNCQVVFESAHKLREEARQMTAPEQESERKDKEWLIKLRYLGNIRLICELFKQQIFPEKIVHHIVQKLLGIDPTKCPEEENVEAICQVFNIICEQLDKNEKSRRINNVYFHRLKELSTNPQLGPRLRLMVCDVLDLRPSNLVRRRDEVKVKTITKIHSEAGKTFGLCPSSIASLRISCGPLAQQSLSHGPLPINRPGTSDMMPGMLGTRKMLGMPGMDYDNQEVPRSFSMLRGNGPLVQPGGRGQLLLVSKSRLIEHKTSASAFVYDA